MRGIYWLMLLCVKKKKITKWKHVQFLKSTQTELNSWVMTTPNKPQGFYILFLRESASDNTSSMLSPMLKIFLGLVVMSLRQFSSKNAEKCNLIEDLLARTKSHRNRCFQLPHLDSGLVFFFSLPLHLIGTGFEERDMEHKAIILPNMITKILLY